MDKGKLVKRFIDLLDGWNHEFHKEIQLRAIARFKQDFPKGIEDDAERERRINDMREFYYRGMTTTGNLLLVAVSIAVAMVALVVSFVALFH